MVWSQFRIKIFRVNFGKSVLDNSDGDKISNSSTKKVNNSNRICNSLWDEKKKIVNKMLLSKVWYIGQVYTVPKFIKREIEKTIAHVSISKCGLGILGIDTQLISLELKWIYRLLNSQCFLENSHAVLIELKE